MHEPEDDAGLVGDDDAPLNADEPDVDQPTNTFDDLMGEPGPSTRSPPPPPPPSRQQETLSEEQVERIERNRLLAMERRKARLLEQQPSTSSAS